MAIFRDFPDGSPPPAAARGAARRDLRPGESRVPPEARLRCAGLIRGGMTEMQRGVQTLFTATSSLLPCPRQIDLNVEVLVGLRR